MGMPTELNEAPQQAKLAASWMMAFAVWVVFISVGRIEDHLVGAALAICVAAGSSMYSLMAQALWSQTGGLFCQAISLLILSRYFTRGTSYDSVPSISKCEMFWLFIGGIFAGFSAFSRPTFVAWAGIYGVLSIIRLRKAAIPAIVGLAIGLFLGMKLNEYAQGSILGLHYEKSVDEVGFGLSPGLLWTNFLAGFLSPYRGLLMWSPWAILIFVGMGTMVPGTKWKQLLSPTAAAKIWLLGQAVFVLAIAAGLLTFKNLWTWEAGSRHSADLLLSGALLAAGPTAWLIRRIWGWGILVILFAPAAIIYHKAASHPYFHGDYYGIVRKVMHLIPEEPMNWRFSPYRYYWTDGRIEREIRGETREPLWDSNQLDMTPENAWRFIEGGLTPKEESLYLHRKNASLLIDLPKENYSAGMNLYIEFEDRPSAPHSQWRQVDFVWNGQLIRHHEWWSQTAIQKIEIPIAANRIYTDEQNRLEIFDEDTYPVMMWEPGLIVIENITITPLRASK